MKIEMNVVYNLPTQTQEDSFLEQAERQGLTWSGSQRATENKQWSRYKEKHCISVSDGILDGWCNKSWYESQSSFPIIEWKIGFTKADMKIGQIYKMKNGAISTWSYSDCEYYTKDLTPNKDTLAYNEGTYDITEVYSMDITPIWKREEVKYRVKTELTKEQAKKLGMELCEVVE